MPFPNQLLRQIGNDPFGPAVELWGHALEEWSNLRDPHSCLRCIESTRVELPAHRQRDSSPMCILSTTPEPASRNIYRYQRTAFVPALASANGRARSSRRKNSFQFGE